MFWAPLTTVAVKGVRVEASANGTPTGFDEIGRKGATHSLRLMP